MTNAGGNQRRRAADKHRDEPFSEQLRLLARYLPVDGTNRWEYRAANAPVVMLAIVAMIACVTFFADPDAAGRSVLGRSLAGHSLDVAYNIAWAVGGALMVFGVWTVRRVVEAVGNIIYAVAILTNFIAISAFYHALTTGTGLTLLAVFSGLLVRAGYLLVRERKLTLQELG